MEEHIQSDARTLIGPLSTAVSERKFRAGLEIIKSLSLKAKRIVSIPFTGIYIVNMLRAFFARCPCVRLVVVDTYKFMSQTLHPHGSLCGRTPLREENVKGLRHASSCPWLLTGTNAITRGKRSLMLIAFV